MSYDQAMTYLTLAAMLLLTVWPILVPAIIHGAHAVIRWRRTHAPAQATSYPLPMASRRRAVPAAA